MVLVTICSAATKLAGFSDGKSAYDAVAKDFRKAASVGLDLVDPGCEELLPAIVHEVSDRWTELVAQKDTFRSQFPDGDMPKNFKDFLSKLEIRMVGISRQVAQTIEEARRSNRAKAFVVFNVTIYGPGRRARWVINEIMNLKTILGLKTAEATALVYQSLQNQRNGGGNSGPLSGGGFGTEARDAPASPTGNPDAHPQQPGKLVASFVTWSGDDESFHSVSHDDAASAVSSWEDLGDIGMYNLTAVVETSGAGPSSHQLYRHPSLAFDSNSIEVAAAEALAVLQRPSPLDLEASEAAPLSDKGKGKAV